MTNKDRSRKEEANKKMIGKIVSVGGDWTGKVIGLKDYETFYVEDKHREIHEVDLYDIRSL